MPLSEIGEVGFDSLFTGMPANRAMLFELEKLGLDLHKPHSAKAIRVAQERLQGAKVEKPVVVAPAPETVNEAPLAPPEPVSEPEPTPSDVVATEETTVVPPVVDAETAKEEDVIDDKKEVDQDQSPVDDKPAQKKKGKKQS